MVVIGLAAAGAAKDGEEEGVEEVEDGAEEVEDGVEEAGAAAVGAADLVAADGVKEFQLYPKR